MTRPALRFAIFVLLFAVTACSEDTQPEDTKTDTTTEVTDDTTTEDSTAEVTDDTQADECPPVLPGCVDACIDKDGNVTYELGVSLRSCLMVTGEDGCREAQFTVRECGSSGCAEGENGPACVTP